MSARGLRFADHVRVASGALGLIATTWALPARGVTEQDGAGADAESHREANDSARSVIVFVGDAPGLSELRALLGELLGRQGVEAGFSTTARFDAERLFDPAPDEDGVRVFLRIDRARRARLYFRGPGGERFLLRTLALPNGLDDVGRELVGQIVESSVIALLRSSEGLSREQASAEVARETREERALTSEGPDRPSAPERSLQASLALRYSIATHGPALAPAHGPGFDAALGAGSPLRWRIRLTAERYFAQRLDARELDATIQSSALRLGFDAGAVVAPEHLVLLALGAGLDVTRVDPGATRVASVTAASPETDVSPILRAALRYELDAGVLVLAAEAFTDIALERTHYDLREPHGVRQLGAPWHVRPGAALGTGVSW